MRTLLNSQCPFCSVRLDKTHKPPRAGSEGVPADIERRAAKCTARLAARHRALREAGKRPCVANVAGARELACWVWEVGCRAEGTLR